MYWGLEVLKNAVEEGYKFSGTFESQGSDNEEDMVDGHNENAKSGNARNSLIDDPERLVLKPALKLGLVRSLPRNISICWVPSGSKVSERASALAASRMRVRIPL